MSPSAKEFETALQELRRLSSRGDWLLRTYRGSYFPGFIAGLQDNLDTIRANELLSRLVRAMLEVASALRLGATERGLIHPQQS